ncbi:SPOR domain-containing protein [Acidihalobacter aeolianus]|uniref:SPOR domain-containing protein n=1 Tax=Acidihalobacter aeolianus TaxID=2792603 RepID=UPI0022B23C57|nr:SPOR domain-containing protein [Acidihalobacter aeolianus]
MVTAWVVQVASLVDENSANMLRDRLRKKGFDSYIDRFRHAGKTYFRVRVGPRLSKPKAESMLVRIDHAVKLKGIVVPYP